MEAVAKAFDTVTFVALTTYFGGLMMLAGLYLAHKLTEIAKRVWAEYVTDVVQSYDPLVQELLKPKESEEMHVVEQLSGPESIALARKLLLDDIFFTVMKMRTKYPPLKEGLIAGVYENPWRMILTDSVHLQYVMPQASGVIDFTDESKQVSSEEIVAPEFFYGVALNRLIEYHVAFRKIIRKFEAEITYQTVQSKTFLHTMVR